MSVEAILHYRAQKEIKELEQKEQDAEKTAYLLHLGQVKCLGKDILGRLESWKEYDASGLDLRTDRTFQSFKGPSESSVEPKVKIDQEVLFRKVSDFSLTTPSKPEFKYVDLSCMARLPFSDIVNREKVSSEDKKDEICFSVKSLGPDFVSYDKADTVCVDTELSRATDIAIYLGFDRFHTEGDIDRANRKISKSGYAFVTDGSLVSKDEYSRASRLVNNMAKRKIHGEASKLSYQEMEITHDIDRRVIEDIRDRSHGIVRDLYAKEGIGYEGKDLKKAEEIYYCALHLLISQQYKGGEHYMEYPDILTVDSRAKVERDDKQIVREKSLLETRVDVMVKSYPCHVPGTICD